MGWKRIKTLEKDGVLGWWEHDLGSIIAITKGLAHVVHRGAAVGFPIPEDVYSSNPNTAGKMIAKTLHLLDDANSQAWD